MKSLLASARAEVANLGVDLFCGLGGWAEGLLAEGYNVVGFDIERHDYGTGGYPGQLVLQDVLTLHGSQFRNAALIVASPPCQAYSYRAMPWKRAKALPSPDNTLFEACFRIQREAIAATGSRTCPECDGCAMTTGCCRCERCDGKGYIYKRYIPLVVENVRGAQKWVGRSAWNYGSYHLWGDIPALMPIVGRIKNSDSGGSWFSVRDGKAVQRNDSRDVRRDENGEYGLKFGGGWWNDSTNNLLRKASSRSTARKAASAQIAKIPFPLASHIARVYRDGN